jgi:hypothetical protein
MVIDFRRRFLTLLSYKFRVFGSVTALSVLEAVNAGVGSSGGTFDLPPLAFHPLIIYHSSDLQILKSRL